MVPEVVAEAIARSCQIKADIVAEDETEQGVRALLNLGHTFGHAIEAHQGYGNWLHGEAVGAGMAMAATLSNRLGWIDDTALTRSLAVIESAGLPLAAPANMSSDDFLARMRLDKKNIDTRLRLVLLNALGDACVSDATPVEVLRTLLDSYPRR